MKNLICALVAAYAIVTVADSQIPKSALAVDTETDVIDLTPSAGNGKIELVPARSGDPTHVDIVCEDATLTEVLRQFRKVVRANIISSDSTNMSHRVSISLYDAPWLDSLKAVIGMGGFVLDERNGIYFVSEEQAASPVVRTKSFELNHANADDLARLLNESFGEKDRKSGKLVGSVANVFKDANIVVVKGNDKLIRDCEEVIKAVDRAPQQVYIEARFIELSSQAMHKLGIDWKSLENYQVAVKNVQLGIEKNRGKLGNYNNSQLTETDTGRVLTPSTVTPSEIPESVALRDTVGGTEQARSMQWSQATAFSGQISAGDFALAMSAFEQMSDVKMFSNPRIIVSNGKKAEVDMTTKYPNVRVTSNRTGGISDSLDITAQLEQIPGEEGAMFAKEVFFSWGISLSVTPRISPDGLINVEIVPMISDLNANTPWAEVSGNGAEGSAYSKYPVIDVQRLVTDFTMKDGSTAVIGGLTRTAEEDVDSGIPYLRKIPWIGPRLFGWKGRSKVQKEIIVFVTVGVANPRKMRTDAGLPKNAILGREFVEGRQLEPGDRESASKSMELDMSAVEDRYARPAKTVKKSVRTNKSEPKKSEPKKAELKKSEPAESVAGEGPRKAMGPTKSQNVPPESSVEKIRHGRAM